MLNKQEKKWFSFYANLAKDYAEFSKDQRTKVGCIIVDKDFTKVLSIGYNGWEKDGPDIPDSNEPGESGSIHGEENALVKMDNKLLYPNSYLFCTHNPCRRCSRLIINVGCIGTVVYTEEYRDLSGLDILKSRGIRVIKHREDL